MLCFFVQAAIIEYHRLGGLNKKFTFSKFWSLEGEGQGANRDGCWWGLFPHLHRIAVSLRPHMAFPLCTHGDRETLGSPPLLIDTHVLSEQDLTFAALFNFNYLFKGPISKYSHIGVYGSTRQVLEGHTQSITDSITL